jgi:hypothetical protein
MRVGNASADCLSYADGSAGDHPRVTMRRRRRAQLRPAPSARYFAPAPSARYFAPARVGATSRRRQRPGRAASRHPGRRRRPRMR